MSSNAGFVGLMKSPMGLFLLGMSLILLTVIIIFGANMVKMSEKKAREERERLKAIKEERDRQNQTPA